MRVLSALLTVIALMITWPVRADDIKIGALFPFTGPAAVFGNQNFQGIDIAAEMVNDSGGVLGGKIVLVKGDAPSPSAAVSEANRLILHEGIKVIIGSTSSSIAIPASQEAEKDGAVYWEGMAVVNQVTARGFRYTFRTGLDAAGLAYPMVDYLLDVIAPALRIAPEKLKIAIVAEDTAYIQVADAVIARLSQHGISPIFREHYSASRATDLSPIIVKLQSLQPDVIFTGAFVNDAILFIRQMKELKYAPKAILGLGTGYTTSALVKAVGNDVNGIFTSGYPADINPTGLTEGARKELGEFKRRYEKKYGSVPYVQEALGFVTGMILFRDILPRAGALDADRIRDAAAVADVPIGSHINGWGVKFDASGQNTRSFAGVMQWQNQELRMLAPADLAVAKPIALPLAPWSER